MKLIAQLIAKTRPSLDNVIAQAEAIQKYARVAERDRILTIIEFGIACDDLRSAIVLALASELSAEDAIAIIDAKQSADCIRPH